MLKQITVLSKFTNDGKSLPELENISFSEGMIYARGLKDCAVANMPKQTDSLAINVNFLKKVKKPYESVRHGSQGGSSDVGIIKVGKETFRLAAETISVEVPNLQGKKSIGVLSLSKNLKYLKGSLGKDIEYRPQMSFVHYSAENQEFVTTDAHVLKRVPAELNLEYDLLISPLMLEIPEDRYKASVSYDNDDIEYLILESEHYTFYFKNRLDEGKYPNYIRVVPTEFSFDLTYSKRDLIEAVDNALICAGETGKLLFTEDGTVIRSEDVDNGLEYSIDIIAEPGEGDVPDVFAFDGRKLKKVLTSLPEETVVIQGISPSKPFILNEYTLLMPMQIS